MTKENIIAKRLEKAIEEVELIRAGKLPKQSAREMIGRVKERLNVEKE